MIISLQPKSDFLKDAKRASAHQDVMASPQFHEASKIALLEYQYSFASVDVIMALKLKGAQDFLRILMNLGEPTLPTVTRPDEQLNPV